MIVAVLAAFAAMLRKQTRVAFILLVLGALVKYVSAVFIPLWLVFELTHQQQSTKIVDVQNGNHVQSGQESLLRRWSNRLLETFKQIDPRAATWLLLESALAGSILLFAFYAPFWNGINTFTGLGQQLRPLYYNSSIVGFISGPLQIIVPPSQHAALDKTLRLVFYTIFLVYGYLQTQKLWFLGSQADMRDVITAAAKSLCCVITDNLLVPALVHRLDAAAGCSRQGSIRPQARHLFCAGRTPHVCHRQFSVCE